MKNNSLHAVLSLVLLMSAATANADSPIAVATRAQVEKIEISPAGERRTRLVPAETVVPGTEVVYTITVSNQGSEPARNVIVDNPVPGHSELVAGSAIGPGSAVSYSVDGGRTYAAPEVLQVREATGAERMARPDEYTNVRFEFLPEIAPGQSVMARFRALVK